VQANKGNERIRARNTGAVAGAVLFLIFGLIPSFFFGSYGTLFLISKLTGVPVETGLLVRVVLFIGISVTISLTAFLSILCGSIIGITAVHVKRFISYLVYGPEFPDQPGPAPLFVRNHNRMSSEEASKIRSDLSFFSPLYDSILSTVVVGSAAFGLRSKNSDIDVVIICKDEDHDGVQSAVCEEEINASLDPVHKETFEFTVLRDSHIKELLRMGSPFMYSLANGVSLDDNGYLKKLKAKGFPAPPGRNYFMKVLREDILVQYFGSMRSIEQAAKENGCSGECCRMTLNCTILPSPHVFAKTIMRMLYVTLPVNGYMPLTKKDAIEFSRIVYGTEGERAVEMAVQHARTNNSSVRYDDYVIMKHFAGKLYRESLAAAGMGYELKEMLKDVSNLMRGNYHHIKDEQLRSCVI